MGNCGSKIDCAACAEGCSRKIAAEPDIVGLGVLISFMLTAFITFAAIIYGYLSESLPTWYLNEFDAAILAMYHDSRISKSLLPSLWSLLKYWRRTITRKPEKPSQKPLDRDKRTEALTRFILALSDQQLVTGLAILIGALSSRCTISSYEYSVVVSLAWFSSMTHLATLDVLRNYFIHNQVVRNVRLVGMVAMMFLLAFGIVLPVVEVDPSTPLQCVIIGFSRNGYNFNFDLYNTIGTLGFLCRSYVRRIGHLFDDQHSEDQLPYSNRERFLHMILRCQHPRLDIDANVYRKLIKQVVSEERKIEKEERLGKANKSATIYRLSILGMGGYSMSFVSNFPAFLFGLCYGVSQVVLVRWYDPADLTEDANTMSFGQIVPLFLLLIPGLAAAETYHDAKKLSNCNPLSYQRPNHTQTDPMSHSSMNQVDDSTCRSTSELRLPDPTHQRLIQEQVEDCDHLRHSSGFSGAVYANATLSVGEHSLHRPARIDSNAPGHPQSHQSPNSFDSRKFRRICLWIFVCCCLSSILLSILLTVPNFMVLLAALILMSVYGLLSLNGAFTNAVKAYSPASERLMEYQRHKDCQDRGLTDSSIDGEIMLREVVISPTSSSHRSFSQVHGALAIEGPSQPVPTPPDQALTPDATISAGDDEDTAQTDTEGPENHTSRLVFTDQELERVSRHQTFPVRQNNASSARTAALDSTANFKTLIRRVKTK